MIPSLWHDDKPIIASMSGGKDSAALCLWLQEQEIKYRGEVIFESVRWLDGGGSTETKTGKGESMTQYRQGDVLIVSMNSAPDERGDRIRAEGGRLILVRGEATGHHHSVSASHAQLFQRAVGMLLLLRRAHELRHQEHAPITLPPGAYLIFRQRKYTPQEIKNVAD